MTRIYTPDDMDTVPEGFPPGGVLEVDGFSVVAMWAPPVTDRGQWYRVWTAE